MAEEWQAQEGGATAPAARPIAELSFEEALAELERIVQMLEREQPDLEAAIKAYERGTQLRRHCEEKLREARLRVEKLRFDEEGEPRLEPFEPQ